MSSIVLTYVNILLKVCYPKLIESMKKFYKAFFTSLFSLALIITFLSLHVSATAAVPACATALSPAAGGTLLNSSTPLTWTAPAGAVTGYYVYIGTTVAATELINGTSVATTSYTYGGTFTCGATYYWKIVPYNVNGSATGCTSQTFKLTSAPTSVAGTAVNICSNVASIAITAGSSATNASSTNWTSSGTAGTITNPTSLTTATYAPSAADISAGSIILTLTSNGIGACTAVASTKTVTITPAPSVSSGTILTTCGSSAVNITAGSSATNYNTITWSSNGSGTFASNNSLTTTTYSPSAADISAGSRNMILTATGIGSCATVTSTKVLTINGVPTITTQPAAAVTTCSGNNGSVTFQVAATGTALTYQWLENGIALSNGGIYSGVTTNLLALNNPTVANNYSVVVSGTCSPSVTSSVATFTPNAQAAPGTPSVFGSGVWNAYCYSSINFTNYTGYYVEPLFSFDTRNRWASGLSPSLASGYQGCTVPATQMSVSFKQTNFTPGTYSLSVNFQDDGFTMLLNGTQVFQNTAYTNTLQSNVWTGTLGASDQVELRLTQGGGGSGLMVTFTSTPTPANSITAGTISGNQTVCSGEVPAQILSNVTSAIATGCSLGSYQWQSSTDSLTWTPIAGANNSTYTISSGLSVTTWYNRIANGACGATATSTPVKVTVYSTAPGDPTVYGNGVWNCYAYALQTFGTYKGYYVEPLFSFDSRNRWTSGTAPSLASGYQGCLVPATQMSMSMKQTNFTPGYYSLSLNFQDDGFTMLVNGVQVFQNNAATATLQSNVWTGLLNATSQVELRLTQGTGGSGLMVTFAPYTPPALLAGTIGGANQHVCTGDTPQLPLSNATPASGGCNWRASSYQWQSSPDSLTWTNINGATASAYTIPGALTADTYYQRTITDDCGQSVVSNVVKVALNNITYGDPTVYGTNQWNVYSYKDITYTTYTGYYVEPLTTFLTTNRYTSGQSPSYASGYLGCNIPVSNFSTSMKRQGVTSSSTGIFQIDVSVLDDIGTLIIDGTQVYTKNCCVTVGSPAINIWTGPLNSSSQIEWKWIGLSGPNSSGLTFTELTPSAYLPGTITGSDTVCSGNKPPLGFTSTSLPSGGCNFSYYQWQYSTDSLTWVNLSNSNVVSYTPVLSIYQKTYFRRVAYDICGTASATLPVVVNMRTTVPGNASVYGTNTWNAYCYNDAAYGQYVGYYTENNLSFDTKNRYANTQPPSSAIPSGASLGFSGCEQLYTYWSVDFKRKGLGANPVGYYQIDMNYQDDGAAFLINGVQVFQNNAYTPSLQSNIWTGLINSTTLLELKLFNNAGPGSVQVTFTYLGATPPTSLGAGTLACNPSAFCSGDLPYINSATPASGACAASYQWQSSPNGTSWSNILGATSLNFNSSTAITATTYYRRTATDACGNTANTAACMLTTTATVTNPGIGNNTWNCLAYNAPDFTSNYSGYYTEPLLSFSTTNRFSNTSPPSYASGYVGCQTSAATFSVRMLRTNFTPATYQIDIPSHDDYVYIIINGVQVYTAVCCVANLNAVWVGKLGATDVVELRYWNNYGPGNLAVNLTVVTPTGTITPSVIGADQLICNAATPAPLTTVTAASAFCYLSYQWQSSTTSISSGYTNISGATLTTYAPAALTQTTYYRLAIRDACGNTANSNAVTITVNPSVVATTNGAPQTICSGQIPASITASPTGGNGAYTYVWQSSTTGPASGFSSTGVTTATYSPPAITVSTWYNVIVTSCGGSTTSASVAVTVSPATAITTQPVNYIGCIGTTGTFTIAATGYNLNYQWQQKINSGAFTNIGTNSNTFSNTITAAMGTNTYTYQCIVTSICAPTSVTSSSVTLSPNTTPTITAQPVAATTCSGSAIPVTFSITATSATSYQWYNATGNVLLTNSGIYSGVTTATLTITGATVATSYYCIISGTPACVGTTQSSSAALTVNPIIATNTITANQTVCANAVVAALAGSTPTGGGGAGTYTYQWSSSTDNVTYTPVSGAIAINYTPVGLTVTTYFNRIVSSTTCVTNTTTTPVTITVNPQPVIPTITGTTTYCVGTAFSLTGNTTSGSPTYAWTAPGTATGLVGAATATISKASVQTTEGGTYSVKATAAGCTSIATSVVVTINKLPAITTQPAASTVVCNGSGVNISVAATGAGLTYQWQQSTDGVAPFTNIVNNGVYNNATTTNLLLYPTSSMNGYYFRCVVSGTCTPAVTTTNSILTIYNTITANTVATAQEICGGATPATLTGSVPNGGTGTYSYQWYSSIDNTTFTALSGATSQNYSPSALTQNTWYYRIAMSPSTGGCGTNTSSTLLITVDPSTNIPTQPINTTTCPAVSTTMNLVATGAGLTYRWQVNPLSGVYTNVSNAALYSGYLTNTLTFTNPSASMNGYQYRCIVTGNCAAGGYSIDTSIVAVLNISSPATITTQPASYNVCAGSNVTYTVGATGSSTLSYQWQQRIAPGSYISLSDGGIVSGSATSSLSLSNVPLSYNGYYYRCVVSMNGCVINTLNTNGLLSVKANPTVTATANPSTICAGTSSNLQALGANTYTWSTGQVANPALVSPSSTTVYTVVGTAINGCANTGNVTVTVNPLIIPSVTISTSTYIICYGTSAVFSTSPVNGGSSPSFQWQVNGVNKTTNSPSNTTYTNSTLNNNDIVKVVMTSNIACGSPLTVSSNTITMTVNPVPTITSSATATSVCFNTAAQNSTLNYSTATNAPISYSIVWNAAAISAGLVNVSSAALPASPIIISVPAGTASATYTGTVVVTNSNCTSTGNAFTLAVSATCPYTWIGVTSTDWNTGSNWSLGFVPTNANDVIIPSGTPFSPTVSSTTSNTASITINTGAFITIGSTGKLNVYGNFTGNGSVSVVPGSTVAFKGTSAQTITGVSSLYNVQVNNTAGISIASPLIVNGSISLLNGMLTTNSNLTINFDNGGNIVYNASDNGSISGNVTGRRDVNYKTHYLSAPFSGVTSAQVAATTPIWVNPYWKMYSKDFTAQNWTAIINTTTAMPIGTGYSLSFVSPAPLSLSGTYNHNLTLTTPNYSNAIVNKYFMVGNPYPATIDWESVGVTKTNIQGAIYYWDGPNNRSASYVSGIGTNGATQYIPAMQAVLVATTGTGGNSSVIINNTARYNLTNPSYFRVASEDIIRIKLESSDPSQKDEAVIRFNEMATDSFDIDLDANKILNTGMMPSVYSVSGSNNYSINSYASPDSAKNIPVAAKLPADGTYTLNILNSNPNIEYVLVDKQLGLEQSITKGYTFSGLKTDNVNRFELRLLERVNSIPTSVKNASSAGGLTITSTINGFVVKTDRYVGQVAGIEIMDVTGNSIKVLSDKTLSTGATFVPLDLASGAYLVKIKLDSGSFTGIVVLTK
jgi:hypothetical protein